MTFQLGIQNFQSWFQKDIKLVKMNSLLKFDDCWEECLGKLDIYSKMVRVVMGGDDQGR